MGNIHVKGPVDQELLLKDFSIWRAEPFVHFGKGHSCDIILNLVQWFRRCGIKKRLKHDRRHMTKTHHNSSPIRNNLLFGYKTNTSMCTQHQSGHQHHHCKLRAHGSLTVISLGRCTS